MDPFQEEETGIWAREGFQYEGGVAEDNNPLRSSGVGGEGSTSGL